MTERTRRITSGAKPTPYAQKSVARPAATTGSTSSRASSNPNELGKAAAASTKRKNKPDQIVRSAEIEQAQVKKSIGERQRAAPNLGAVSPIDFARMLPEIEELVHAFGVRTEAAASGLTLGFVRALGERGAMFRSLVLAMGAEMEPTDMVEAMLVHQIAITHSTMMRASGMAWDANSIEVVEAYDRIMNRTARTFAAQVEALRRYRSGGDQTIRVERVTVNDGGQAVVGNVSIKGGRNEK